MLEYLNIKNFEIKTNFFDRFGSFDRIKSVLFLKEELNDFGEDICLIKQKNVKEDKKVNIHEYIVKNDNDDIGNLDTLLINNHIDVIVCKEKQKYLAEDLYKIYLSKRGFKKKELLIWIC